MGWWTKLFKGHKSSYRERYGDDRIWDEPRTSVVGIWFYFSFYFLFLFYFFSCFSWSVIGGYVTMITLLKKRNGYGARMYTLQSIILLGTRCWFVFVENLTAGWIDRIRTRGNRLCNCTFAFSRRSKRESSDRWILLLSF